MRFFVRLALEMVAAFASGRISLWAQMRRDFDGCPALLFRSAADVSKRLRLAWELMWYFLVDRHPKLVMANLLSDIGDAIDHKPWPYDGRELDLIDWVDSGMRLPLP